MNSTEIPRYSLLRRTAIAVCLGTSLFFAFRAATPDARATAAVPAVAVSETVDAAVPDTVLTTCNIEDIQAGDLVLARDEHGQEIGLKPVKEVYKRTSFHLRHLTFESTDGDQQTLSTTDEHPFWSVTADEFVEAGSLPVGHKVTDPHGKTQTLVSSTREEFPSGIPVFNFQVEDFHTYYVAANAGDDVLLVHNADYLPPRRLDMDSGVHGPNSALSDAIDRAIDTGNVQGKWLSAEACREASKRAIKGAGPQHVPIASGDGIAVTLLPNGGGVWLREATQAFVKPKGNVNHLFPVGPEHVIK